VTTELSYLHSAAVVALLTDHSLPAAINARFRARSEKTEVDCLGHTGCMTGAWHNVTWRRLLCCCWDNRNRLRL